MDEADTWHGDRRFFVLDGDPTPSPKGGNPSPILRVVVENFEIGPEVPPPEVAATSGYS